MEKSLKTIDGGENWDCVYFEQAYRPIYDIHCPTSNTCYARTSMEPKFLKSTDGGETWSAIFSVPNTYLFGGMHPINKDTIVMVSSDALILRSTNGGTTWDTIPSPVNAGFLDVFFIDNVGYAVGREETIIKSTDAGKTWTLELHDSTSLEWITAVHMVDEDHAFACSNLGSIYRLEPPTSSKEQLPGEDNFNVYPNPFSDHLTVQFNQPKSGVIGNSRA